MNRSSAPWFDGELFERLRMDGGVTWGRPVRVIEATPSTNDLGLEAASGDAKTGIVWVAREQVAGRGRRGTRWHAAPGQALLMSTLLRWPAPADHLRTLGLAVGLAVREVVSSRAHGPALLKWPNDVLVSGRKVSGVLVESKRDGQGTALVLGVGINVHARAFPEEAGNPTSLWLEGARGEALCLEALLVELLGALERRVPPLLRKSPSPIVDEAREYDALRGRSLAISQETQTTEGVQLFGRGAGLSDDGSLLVETELGRVAVDAGHVSLLD